MKAIRLLRYLSEYFAMTHKGAVMSIQEAIAELEALQSRSCEGCKYCAKVFSYTYPIVYKRRAVSISDTQQRSSGL